MLIITPEAMDELRDDVPAIAQMLRVMDDRHVIELHKRLNSLMCTTADTRYQKLEMEYPQFLQRFPQHFIASYLGITKETLDYEDKAVFSD